MLLRQLSCTVDSALTKHPRGFSRGHVTVSAPHTAVQAQIKGEKKKIDAFAFHCLVCASLVIFTLCLLFPPLVLVFISVPCFVFTSTIYSLWLCISFRSFVWWHFWFFFSFCACGKFPQSNDWKGKSSSWSSSRRPFFCPCFRTQRFEDVLFWFVPRAAGPHLRLCCFGTLSPLSKTSFFFIVLSPEGEGVPFQQPVTRGWWRRIFECTFCLVAEPLQGYWHWPVAEPWKWFQSGPAGLFKSRRTVQSVRMRGPVGCRVFMRSAMGWPRSWPWEIKHANIPEKYKRWAVCPESDLMTGSL